MARRSKKSDISEIVDGTLTPSEEELEENKNREIEIQKQKEKRKKKEIEQKEKAKKEKEQKKKVARKKAVEKKKRENQKKQVEKQKAEKKKRLEKKQKEIEKKKNILKKEKEKEKKKIEKQKKLEEQRKREERERRIEQRKRQKEIDDFEYEANSAINMTMKNNKRKQMEEEYNRHRDKEIRKKRKKRRIITSLLLIAIVLGGTVFALVSPIFNIQNIQVSGNEQVASDTIESLSGLSDGQNIFKFLKKNVINDIKKEPYIESVEVKRVLPNTIQIKVKERKKRFAIKFLNSYAIINSQGYILELSENQGDLPIISGITTPEEEITKGRRLNENDLNNLEIIIKIMNISRDNNIDELISGVEITKENEINIQMDSEKKVVHLGDDTNLSNKIIYVSAIINQTKEQSGDIFVNGDLNNKFKPYFREKIQ